MSELHIPAAPVEVINAFTSAALTALQELTQIEAYPESSVQPLEDASGPVVSAVIPLLREVPGTMTLLLPAETAAHLAARYLPLGTTLTDDLIDDVAGEFANVIAGQAKTMLKGTSYHFTISTPRVTRAANLTDLPITNAQPVASLDCEAGRIRVFLELPSEPRLVH